MRPKTFAVILIVFLSIQLSKGQTPLDCKDSHRPEFGLTTALGVVFNAPYKQRPVIQLGGFGSWRLKDRWILSAEVNYIYAGFYAEKTTFINTPPDPYYRLTTIDALHMLDIPLMGHFRLTERLSVGAGYGYTQIVSFRERSEEFNTSPADQLDIDVRSIDPSLVTEIRFRADCDLSMRIRYRHGLTNILFNTEPRYVRWVNVGISYTLPFL